MQVRIALEDSKPAGTPGSGKYWVARDRADGDWHAFAAHMHATNASDAARAMYHADTLGDIEACEDGSALVTLKDTEDDAKVAEYNRLMHNIMATIAELPDAVADNFLAPCEEIDDVSVVEFARELPPEMFYKARRLAAKFENLLAAIKQ